ncbi:MAG: S41 family peptidase [Bacillota bacterium]|nr:S41 family peptidase [Bacillota bacterium]
MKKFLKVLLITAVLVLGSVASLQVLSTNLGFSFYIFPPSLESVGSQALARMDKFGIYSSSAQWQDSKLAYKKLVKEAQDQEDLVRILDDASKLAGGKHSSCSLLKSQDQRTDLYIEPTIKKDQDLLYIKLPEFVASSDQEQAYAEKLAEALADQTIKKVIVDLRDNPGGSMYPMILGLAPILPEGRVFSLVDKNNRETMAIDLDQGRIKAYKGLEVSKKEKLADGKIAVLCGPGTGSSAEATLLALKGLDQVKVFGQPTAGYLSVNQGYVLGDDIFLNLTVGFFKDRQGKIYGQEALEPDFPSQNPYEDALVWLNEN